MLTPLSFLVSSPSFSSNFLFQYSDQPLYSANPFFTTTFLFSVISIASYNFSKYSFQSSFAVLTFWRICHDNAIFFLNYFMLRPFFHSSLSYLFFIYSIYNSLLLLLLIVLFFLTLSPNTTYYKLMLFPSFSLFFLYFCSSQYINALPLHFFNYLLLFSIKFILSSMNLFLVFR